MRIHFLEMYIDDLLIIIWIILNVSNPNYVLTKEQKRCLFLNWAKLHHWSSYLQTKNSCRILAKSLDPNILFFLGFHYHMNSTRGNVFCCGFTASLFEGYLENKSLVWSWWTGISFNFDELLFSSKKYIIEWSKGNNIHFGLQK